MSAALEQRIRLVDCHSTRDRHGRHKGLQPHRRRVETRSFRSAETSRDLGTDGRPLARPRKGRSLARSIGADLVRTRDLHRTLGDLRKFTARSRLGVTRKRRLWRRSPSRSHACRQRRRSRIRARVCRRVASRLVVSGLAWPEAHRIVPSPDAPVAAFASLVDDPAELEVLLQVEALTNPLAREASGNLPAIPADRRYRGPLAGLVMLPFLLPRESRFSDGFYGVLYTADIVDTALDEAAYHAGRRLAAAAAPAGTTLRLFGYTLHVAGDVVDAQRGRDGVADDISDPDSWSAAQTLGRTLRTEGHIGLHYTSVRRSSGTCVGAFWPDIVRSAAEASRWLLFWNGSVFEHRAQERRP